MLRYGRCSTPGLHESESRCHWNLAPSQLGGLTMYCSLYSHAGPPSSTSTSVRSWLLNSRSATPAARHPTRGGDSVNSGEVVDAETMAGPRSLAALLSLWWEGSED